MGRVVFSATALLSVSALALTACSPDDTGGTEGDAPQNFAVALSDDVDGLLPWTATHFSSVRVLENVYGTLTELDEELNVVPGLAESWETSEDGLTVTFDLREDVTFHDGTEFDAEDVVASYNAIQDEETAAVSATYLAAVDEVEATDSHTVTITLATPDAALPSKLALNSTAILPDDADLDAIESEPNGTGPFSWGSRTANESLTLDANPDYWGGEPELDSVEFRIIPDEQAIVSALQADSVHMATFDEPLLADSIGGNVEVVETSQLDYQALQINSDVEPLDDVNVRLAIACTIDREEVLESAAMGAGELTGPITSPVYRSDPNARPCPEPDLERARDYLAEAGYEDGLALSTIVMGDGYPSHAVAQVENIQAQLDEIGVSVDIESLESGTYVDRWNETDFDLALALNGGQPDPDVMYRRFFASDGSLNDVATYSSETLDDLFAEGQEEEDEDARVEIYDEIAAELEEEAVWIWLFSPYEYTALTENVTGYTPLSNGSMRTLRDTSLEQ